MTSSQLVTVILAAVGVILQLAFMYSGKFAAWYQVQPNKGLIALGLSVLFGFVYLGLACSPLAVMMQITLACTYDGLYSLLRAIFIIAVSQQTSFGILKEQVKRLDFEQYRK